MSSDIRAILLGVLQFLIGAALCGAYFALLVFSQHNPIGPESWVEVGQETLVLVSALLFFAFAASARALRGGLLLVAGFLSSLFIRELDCWFDLIFHGSWKYFLLLFLLSIAYGVRASDIRTVIPGLAHFIRSRSFVWMVTGVVFLIVLSRLMGMKAVWEFYGYACGETWKDIKTFAEEAFEIIGYLFIFVSALGYRFELPRKS